MFAKYTMPYSSRRWKEDVEKTPGHTETERKKFFKELFYLIRIDISKNIIVFIFILSFS